MNKPKKCIFVGAVFNLNQKRDIASVYISINDGFFCIDSDILEFKILSKSKNGDILDTEEELKTIKQVCVDDVACFRIGMKKNIILERSLMCEHEWIDSDINELENIKEEMSLDGKPESVVGSSSIYKSISCQVASQRICKKCKMPSNFGKPDVGLCEISNINVVEMGYIIRDRYIDCDYLMLIEVLNQLNTSIYRWMKKYSKENNTKLVAIGFEAFIMFIPQIYEEVKRTFWFGFDALPCIFSSSSFDSEEAADILARQCTRVIGFENLLRMEIGLTNKVNVDSNVISFCSLSDYVLFLGPLYSKIVYDILAMKDMFKDKKISFFSSTPQGGGVALLRHAQMRFYKLLGLDVSWYVTTPSQTVFKITKHKFHNILQDVAAPDTELKEEDKAIYEKWCLVNFKRFWENGAFKNSDIVVLDDHQMSGFCSLVRSVNPKAKVIYRSHIQIRSEMIEEKRNLKNVWEYINENIKEADYCVFHPKKSFVPDSVPSKKVIYIPPSTDPLDGLNKTITEDVTPYYEHLFNKYCLEYNQPTLDFTKPYIVQIARFDPAKGIKDAIDAFGIFLDNLKEKHLKENNKYYGLKLVLCGHGSVDDPEAEFVYADTIKYLKNPNNAHIAPHVIAVKIPPSDQILNLVLSKAKICLQLSLSEGFEVKVTESILKNVPVIVYDNGGLPLQVEHGKVGFIVKSRDIKCVAHYMEYLLDNSDFRKIMNKQKYKIYVNTTPFVVLGWMNIFKIALNNEEGNFRNLMKEIYDKYLEPNSSKG